MKIVGRFTTTALRCMAALPLATVFFGGTTFAFSDMNDSVAQAALVKTLQKRVDSLEVRVEKTEIERKEEKKMAVDWDRGMFVNTAVGIPNMLNSKMTVGYMLKFHRKNGTSTTLSPVLHFGPYQDIATLRGWSDSVPEAGSSLMFGTGIQKSDRIFDRVSYTIGMYLDALPDPGDDLSILRAVGLGWEGSINFWFDEKNSVGVGFDMGVTAVKAKNESWHQWLNAEGPTGSVTHLGSDFRVQYTYYFAKHSGRAR